MLPSDELNFSTAAAMVETFIAVLRAASVAALDSSEALPARRESLAALSLNDCSASLTKERTLLTASSKSLIAPLSSLPRFFAARTRAE